MKSAEQELEAEILDELLDEEVNGLEEFINEHIGAPTEEQLQHIIANHEIKSMKQAEEMARQVNNG